MPLIQFFAILIRIVTADVIGQVRRLTCHRELSKWTVYRQSPAGWVVSCGTVYATSARDALHQFATRYGWSNYQEYARDILPDDWKLIARREDHAAQTS
jgi:hypothetical protein